MYSWGSGHDDFKPRTAGKFSFEDARRAYDAARPSTPATRAGDPSPDAVPFSFRDGDLVTSSPYPIVVAIDTTGSMEEWPRIFFEKLPLLHGEAQKYFPGCAISFQAINDYHADGPDVCFQPAPFGQGPELDGLLSRLHVVGGGGGQNTESYEVAAAWNAVRMKTPFALMRPLVIFVGDEAPFDEVPAEVGRLLGLSSLDARDAFRMLHERAEVFLVRKPYHGAASSADRTVMARWEEIGLVAGERVLTLDDPRRIVDVLLGILGILAGAVAGFRAELTSRQTRAQTGVVLRTLRALLSGALGRRDVEDGRRSLNPGAATGTRHTKDLTT